MRVSFFLKLTELAGVGAHTVYRIEAGQGQAQARTVSRLTEALGVDPKELRVNRERPGFHRLDPPRGVPAARRAHLDRSQLLQGQRLPRPHPPRCLLLEISEVASPSLAPTVYKNGILG